jgi:DNA (cytosine-5)-methyltransferase 1
MLRSVELFAGAGGLALGCEMAGFRSQKVVEWDPWACDTIRENKADGFSLVKDWTVHQGDVRKVDWTDVFDADLDLVAGGPPCQPFSMGGKHKAHGDKRNMFPATAEVIRQLRPRAFIVENVKGLTRQKFANYVEYIKLWMALPEITPREGEDWLDHWRRLQAEHTSTANHDLTYNVTQSVVNAADYGVPQQRHRVFFVGFRSDVDAEWAFPAATHSQQALLRSQWLDGDYWDRHKVAEKDRPPKPTRGLSRMRRDDLGMLPWLTVRDGLQGLPEPTVKGSKTVPNHVLQEGARAYKGHTGSALDEPAKTLKAGDHGVPGGENMLRRVDGTVRYFTVREAARMQTFPDDYELHGAWTEAMRQLGNAVPVRLARIVAVSVASHLAADRDAGPEQLRLSLIAS